jgi:hypothetical protein
VPDSIWGDEDETIVYAQALGHGQRLQQASASPNGLGRPGNVRLQGRRLPNLPPDPRR